MLQHIPGKPSQTILLRNARQLLTLRGSGAPLRGTQMREVGLIPDGAALIQDGVIVETGSTRRLENVAAARGAVEINAAGRLVMPGFVDAHTHLLWPPGSAACPDRGRVAQYLRSATRQRIEAHGRRHLEAMARHGSTTVEVKTGFGVEENAEAKLLRALAGLQDCPLETVPTFLLNLPETGSEQALETAIRELLPRIRRGRVARFTDILWDESLAPAACLERYLHAAQALGFTCKIHAHRPHPAAAIVQAAAHHAASIDHLEYAGAEEAELLACTSLVAILLPIASFHERGPAAPARMLADAGVAVALGTNFNPGEFPSFSMQTVIALACRELGLTPEEAICGATINAAHALGLASTVGSLETGKSADLIILNIPDYRELPENLGGNLVAMTMRRGEVIYQEAPVGREAQSEAPEHFD